MVRICDIQFRNPGGAIGGIRLPYCLDDAWESSPKLHRLRGDLLVGSVVDTWRAHIGFFRQVKDEAQSEMRLEGCHDVGYLELLPNIHTESAVGSRMLKPLFTLRCISPWVNTIISE